MIRSQLLPLTMLSAMSVFSAQAEQEDCFTDVKPYAVSVSEEYVLKPLLSVGEKVPMTGNPAGQYQFVGIPDGLGAHKLPGQKVALFMNHEFTQPIQSEPNVGGPLQRGSFVSRFVLSKSGCVLSGARAYDEVYVENALAGPAAEVGNATPAFGRLCSGSLSWQEAGFDRPIYFAGEESDSGGTFDARGGSGVAFLDNRAHVLPKFGHLPFENILIQPSAGAQTVALILEDGPSSPDSQLYMYVGRKDRFPGAGVLRRNGLDNGKLFVFVPTSAGMTDENAFTGGEIDGTWVEIPGAESKTAVELEAAADAAGAFGFYRVEDGAFSKTNRHEFLFVTTGAGGSNKLGRVYQLKLNAGSVTGPCKLSVRVNADEVDAAGGDTAFSPDNVDTSREFLMVCEDGTATSRPEMASRARDGSIWRYDLKGGFGAKRVVELNPPGTDTTPVGAGVWETSGIIDASRFFGRGSWIFDVQAHPPTGAPEPNTFEDGQLILMLPSCVRPGDLPCDD